MDSVEDFAGKGPLAGIRVLDLSRVLAGPWCTQCLADLGADVLKIEQPGTGDDTRSWGPPYMDDLAAYFVCANRSKRSLVVDLKKEDGRNLIRRLATLADVLVENFRVGMLRSLSLGYEDLARINASLVYCSITGYGQNGANADRPGYDFIAQGESGLMSVTGLPDGPPLKVGVAVSDLTAGFYATQSILAALIGRGRTGRGQHIDVALLDCQIAALVNVASNSLATNSTPQRYGNAHPNVVPYEVFEAADGPLIIAIGNDAQFKLFCTDVLARPDLANDPGYSSNAMRQKNRELLCAEVRDMVGRESRSVWLDRLNAAGLPGCEVRTVDQALDSDQARSRALLHNFDGTGMRVVKYPVRLSDGLPTPRKPPRLGEAGDIAVAEWIRRGPSSSTKDR